MSSEFKSRLWNGFFVAMFVCGILAYFVVESSVESWFLPILVIASFAGAVVVYYRADIANDSGEDGGLFGFLFGLGIFGIVLMGIPVSGLIGILLIVGFIGFIISLFF